MDYVLERQQFLPEVELEDAFGFFADAGNLERITPPWMSFRILTPRPIVMRPGTVIDYRLKLFGVPTSWRTVIPVWEPPHRFVDLQQKGPYAAWEHTHELRREGSGVLMADRVVYRLPLGPLGRLVHELGIRAMLAAIFDYRYRTIREVFAGRRSGRPAAAASE